ncbi:PREDICTED: RING-H2 finger protein ATL33-like [Ipomoea nil]|uniref:RING-H2 finger protein ATL33-like n=1 Tax=Ipomoea nil TaxID=35883 RepID=UPI00090161A8|nr:PREDICTED: RING-H2 finger protein ATL33-like [Ipomoea nil]
MNNSTTTPAAATITQVSPESSPAVPSESSGDSALTPILSVLAFILIPILIYAVIFSIRCPRNPFRSADEPSKEPKTEKQRLELVSTVKYKRESPENESGAECSVCLSAFVDGEEISELNDCKHTFHAKCIATWLRSRSTCPICRTSLPVKRSRRPPIKNDDDLRQGLPDASNLV